MKLLSAFVAGLIFGLGLILSGMANPSKVIAFLDLAGPGRLTSYPVARRRCLACYLRARDQKAT